jgi:pimeloyl-ACP methyl ester carboxylesterase
MKTLNINDIKLNYTEANTGRSRAILFLNGNSHSSKCFYKQLEDQRFNEYRLICVDLPGHGGSSFLDEYSLVNLANIIKKFIELINLDEFIVVGHSLGGHVSIHLLNDISPNGLVVFGTPPLTIPFSMDGFMDNKNVSPLSLETSSLENLEILSRELRYDGKDKEIFIEDYYKTDKNFRTHIFQSVFNGQYYDELKLLGQYPGKVMTIISNQDRIVSNEYISQVFKNQNSLVNYFEGGHSPQIEMADEFNSALLDFADGIFNFGTYQVNNSYLNLNTIAE